MRSNRTNHKADRELLVGLVDALSVSRSRLKRDECGDWNIFGRRGHISTDGTAVVCLPGVQDQAQVGSREA